MDKTKMQTNKILRGSFGRAWINGINFANIKSFEAKVSFEYEEVDAGEDLGKHQRLIGYTVDGTIVLHKINSEIPRLLKDIPITGDVPDVKIIVTLDDPSAYGAERVELTEVTFDEMMLLKFERKALVEEELPFKAASYRFLDLM